jgi:sugar lactone lactonase YvrE
MRKTSVAGRRLALVSLAAILAVHSAGAAGGFTNGQAASVVLGQPDFVTHAAAAAATAGSLRSPTAVAVDASGNVWVADRLNNRVLQFKPPFSNGQAAAVVLGQPDLTSNAQNNGGRTASSLASPNGLAIDPSGNVWVADAGANNRVLRYSPPFTNFMAASLVLGAADFASVTSGLTQNSFSPLGAVGGPGGLAFDSSGNIWVTDDANNRVLRFNAPFTNGEPASMVLGQANFTSGSAATPPTASSLNSPSSVAVDSSGSVWVADFGNNRVLKYSSPVTNGQAAALVIGQTVFTSSSTPTSPSASSLRQPAGVAVDSNGHLWVTDRGNSRILEYDPPFANGQAASVVLGQSDLVSNALPAPPTASSLAGPLGAVASGAQQLWVADFGNNRVLAYTPAGDGGGGGRGGGEGTLNPISPPDFPYKVTAEIKCVESFGPLCLQLQIVKLCVGGNCFGPLPPPTPPPCVRCLLGASFVAGALVGGIGAMVLIRRRRP